MRCYKQVLYAYLKTGAPWNHDTIRKIALICSDFATCHTLCLSGVGNIPAMGTPDPSYHACRCGLPAETYGVTSSTEMTITDIGISDPTGISDIRRSITGWRVFHTDLLNPEKCSIMELPGQPSFPALLSHYSITGLTGAVYICSFGKCYLAIPVCILSTVRGGE